MKRFLVYSVVLIGGLTSSLPVMAQDEVRKEEMASVPADKEELVPGDAMTYFASGDYQKALEKRRKAEQTEAQTNPKVKNTFRNDAEIIVHKGQVQMATKNARQEQEELDVSDFPVKNLANIEPAAGAEAKQIADENTNKIKVLDEETGVRTNIIINTDTGVEITP